MDPHLLISIAILSIVAFFSILLLTIVFMKLRRQMNENHIQRRRGILEPRNHVLYPARDTLEFPGIQVGRPDRHIVWGLTYSFLESFFDALGRPLPDRWTPSMRAFARQQGDESAQ